MEEFEKNVNPFSLEHYSDVLNNLLKRRKNLQLEDWYELGCPNEGYLIIRHDLDLKPNTLPQVLDVEKNMGMLSTTYVRVAGSNYNIFSYEVFGILKRYQKLGFAFGLHSNPFEFATINSIDPKDVIHFEVEALRAIVPVSSIACHRDWNYCYNSLPWLEKNWKEISQKEGFKFQAYDDKIMKNSKYINEGADNRHLDWNHNKPQNFYENNQTVYLMTHSHWWYSKHPFENEK